MPSVERLVEETVRDPNERRLTSRLVKYWNVFRAVMPLPSRHEFKLDVMPELESFAFALDLNVKPPVFRFIGTALRDEMGCDLTNRPVTSVPPGTIVAWIAEDLGATVNGRRPVDYVFSFIDRHDQEVKVRGVVLPFSDDGTRVDFIFGAITLKKIPK